jgi:hypothetical protein
MSHTGDTERIARTAKAGPRLTPEERQELWIDTCREVTQMHIVSQVVLQRYQKHGCRFTVPSRQQVQDVLDALDSAMPMWENEHSELFYQTLELNFPELLRRP